MFPLTGVVCLLAGVVAGTIFTLLVLAETKSWPGALMAGLVAAGGVTTGLSVLLNTA